MRTGFICIAALLQSCMAVDSRDINPAEFNCTVQTGVAVSVAFGNQFAVCGDEVLFNASQTRPTLIMSAVNSSDLYTVIVVDRDAPNASVPIRSPLRHMAFGGVQGSQLQGPGGLGPSVVIPNAWFDYSSPRPPASSGCHRYYVMVYRQDPGVTPYLAVNTSNPTDRYNWDFPTWAANNSLTKVAVNYFRTQNADTRTGGCDAVQSGALSVRLHGASRLAAGLVTLLLAVVSVRAKA